MNTADRIQSLRKARGLSQEELADKIGVSRQAVSKWESEQSLPDLDKIIIMSEYFDVTTDFILKGIENPKQADEINENFIWSKVLYIASTVFLVIGLLLAFGGWYAEQSPDVIWASMIIQAVGIAGYYIGKAISQEKPTFIVKLANIAIILFMPISMLVGFVLNRFIAPYPTDLISAFVFGLTYLAVMVLAFCVLRRRSR